jgi:hypothetical protein
MNDETDDLYNEFEGEQDEPIEDSEENDCSEDYYDYREEQSRLREDTFYALTDGQYGDYHDDIDMDNLMDGLGY